MRITLQFCKANTHFEVEEREKKRGRKIIDRALSFPCGWHVLAHRVKGGLLLQISSLKATNNYQRHRTRRPKSMGAFYLLMRALHVLTIVIYKKIITSLTPQDNCKKELRSKNQKCPFTLGKKKSWPQGLWGN